MRLFISLCLFVGLSSSVMAQPVNTFLIDNFNNIVGVTADSVIDNTNNASAQWANFGSSGSPITNVLGGRRVLGNFLTEDSGGTFTNNTQVGDGVFSIANPFNTRSGGQIIWDAGNNASLPSGGIIAHPVNFALGNLNFNTIVVTPGFYFQWSVINADSRNWTYTIRAYTGSAANYFEGSITSSASGIQLSIPRSSFVTGAGTPNWGDIDAISFSASYSGGLLGGDLAIDFFQIAVPEMSTYLMLGLMLLLGGSFYAYRRGAQGETKPEEKKAESEATTATTVTPAVAAAA